jgi:hypothetical protein
VSQIGDLLQAISRNLYRGGLCKQPGTRSRESYFVGRFDQSMISMGFVGLAAAGRD